jgi:hypothetical protein
MQRLQGVCSKAGFFKRRNASFFDFGKCVLNADTQCRRAGNAGSQQAATQER